MAQQDREFRELDYTCPNGTVFIRLQSANGPSGPTTTYGRYVLYSINTYAQQCTACHVILSHICHNEL